MIKKIIGLIIIVDLIASAFVVLEVKGYPTSVPLLPNKILVYKIIYEDQGMLLANYSKKFNITGDIRDNMIIADKNLDDSNTRVLAISNRPFQFEYTDYTRFGGSDPRDSPELVPTDENAILIAKKYLKDKDLVTDDVVFSGISHPIYWDSTGKIYHKEAFVSFDHVLNNLTVRGDKISISVGGGGDILYVSGSWKKVEPYLEVPIISPDQAYNELPTTDKLMNITNITLIYTGDDYPCSDPIYVVPVYSFSGKGVDYDVSAVPSLEISFSGKGVYYNISAVPSLENISEETKNECLHGGPASATVFEFGSSGMGIIPNITSFNLDSENRNWERLELCVYNPRGYHIRYAKIKLNIPKFFEFRVNTNPNSSFYYVQENSSFLLHNFGDDQEKSECDWFEIRPVVNAPKGQYSIRVDYFLNISEINTSHPFMDYNIYKTNNISINLYKNQEDYTTTIRNNIWIISIMGVVFSFILVIWGPGSRTRIEKLLKIIKK